MSVTQVATRYATSLLEEAQGKGVLEETYRDMITVEETLKGSRELLLMLKSPIVKDGVKLASLQAIFGPHLGKLTNDFLALLVKKRRERYLVNIIKAFFEAYNEHKNIKEVILVSASPLSEEMESRIIKMIHKQVDAASLDIKKSVDPGLLGGFVIKIGDRVFDTSLNHKLNALRREILAG